MTSTMMITITIMITTIHYDDHYDDHYHYHDHYDPLWWSLSLSWSLWSTMTSTMMITITIMITMIHYDIHYDDHYHYHDHYDPLWHPLWWSLSLSWSLWSTMIITITIMITMIHYDITITVFNVSIILDYKSLLHVVMHLSILDPYIFSIQNSLLPIPLSMCMRITCVSDHCHFRGNYFVNKHLEINITLLQTACQFDRALYWGIIRKKRLTTKYNHPRFLLLASIRPSLLSNLRCQW